MNEFRKHNHPFAAIYRVVDFTVYYYKSPLLQIHGTTRCGLYFVLRVDKDKMLSLAVGQNIEKALINPPCHFVSMKDEDAINQSTVFNKCHEYRVCAWEKSQINNNNKKQFESMWNDFKTEIKLRPLGVLGTSRRKKKETTHEYR